MAKWQDDRPPWEHAGGPEVGTDVPITSAPRPEVKPGVPAPPPGERADEDAGVEEREVKVEDPDLSDHANERLTEEVREVVGEEKVTVPRDRPRPSRGEQPEREGIDAFLGGHRLFLARTFAVAVVFGAILALVTKSWWFLPLAAGLHALGTMIITALALRTTRVAERPAPTTVALLEEEGVRDAEQHFSDIVAEFQPEEERSAADQSNELTPSAEPSEPTHSGGVPAAVNWSVVLGLVVLSIVLPAAFGGGLLWLLTAVMLPLAIGWIVLQRFTESYRDTGAPRSQTTIATVAVLITVAVAGFCAVVALAFQV